MLFKPLVGQADVKEKEAGIFVIPEFPAGRKNPKQAQLRRRRREAQMKKHPEKRIASRVRKTPKSELFPLNVGDLIDDLGWSMTGLLIAESLRRQCPLIENFGQHEKTQNKRNRRGAKKQRRRRSGRRRNIPAKQPSGLHR